MAIGIGTALAGASLAASAFGKKDKGAKPGVSGFGALPKPVQEAFLNVYLPKVLEQANRPFQPLPMKRVEPAEQGDIFASQGLQDLQQYSDSIGGLFTPLDGQQGSPQGAQAARGADTGLGATFLARLAGAQPRTTRPSTQQNPFDILMAQVNQASPGQFADFGSAVGEQNLLGRTNPNAIDINSLLRTLGGGI